MSGRTRTDAIAWRRRAAVLFDQQLWSFGYDIRRPEGNLLVAMGCERLPAPAEARCGSCYRASLHGREGATLLLRGFGVLCEGPGHGALFLHRDRFAVDWIAGGTLPTLPWLPDDAPQGIGVPRHARRAAAGMIAEAAEWFARYEEYVARTCGETYRVEALSERVPRGFVSPGEAPSRWRRLATDLLADPELVGTGPTARRAGGRRRNARPLART